MDVNGKHAFQASDTFRFAYQSKDRVQYYCWREGRPSSVNLMIIQLLSPGTRITEIEWEHPKW